MVARYPLALHGFARFETFAVESSTPDFARLTLSDNARTRAVYPFAFALTVEYRLAADVARDCDRSRQSRREGSPLRLRAASGLPLAARRGRTRWRSCAVR